MKGTGYLTLATEATAELEIKKSRFIAIASRVKEEADIKRILEQTRLEYTAASHVCYAYIIGPPRRNKHRCSDDGEPRGSAGKPILNVLLQRGFGDILVIVVRYYGGTKLGKGGLARAYSAAAIAATIDVETKTVKPMLNAEITCDYSSENKIRRSLSSFKIDSVHVSYDELLTLSFWMIEDDFKQLHESIADITDGASQLKAR